MMVFSAILSIFLIVGAIFVFRKQPESQDFDDKEAKIVIDPAKAFCQRMKFVVRMKKRMKEFKARKDASK